MYAALHPQRNNDYAQVKITGPELLELLKSAEASFEAFYKKIHDMGHVIYLNQPVRAPEREIGELTIGSEVYKITTSMERELFDELFKIMNIQSYINATSDLSAPPENVPVANEKTSTPSEGHAGVIVPKNHTPKERVVPIKNEEPAPQPPKEKPAGVSSLAPSLEGVKNSASATSGLPKK